MDTFTLVKSALAKSDGDTDKVGLDARTVEIGRITAAVQVVVDALTPPDGGRYIVGFVDMATAATDLNARRIIVSSKPVFDRSLSLVEKAVVVATFAAHEIGHTIVTRPRADLIKQHNPKSGYHAVANLADDIILEPVMVDRFPILADAFAFTGEWVLRNTAKTLPRVERGGWTTTPERFNTLISATRYGDIAEIVWEGAAALNEKAWGRDWAARLCAADLRDHATFLALCDEAWERIRSREEDETVEEPPVTDGPTQPGGDEPQPGDEDGEDEDGDEADDQPTTDGPTQPGEPTDEDGDEQGEDEGEGGSGESDEDEDGEDGDEPGESDEDGEDGDDATDDGDGEDEGGDGDEPGDDESDGTDEGGSSTDWGDESDADGDEGEPGEGDDPGDGSDDEDADGDPGQDGDGGGGNASADGSDLRDEDEWNDDDVDQTTHTEAHKQKWDYEGERVDEAQRTYANTGTTAFGRHGKITTTWS